jgi:hypothetical protein
MSVVVFLSVSKPDAELMRVGKMELTKKMDILGMGLITEI